MSNQADLDAAIAALPDNVAASVVAAVQPLIQSPNFDAEIENLNALPAAVAEKVVAQLTPPAP